MNQNVHYIEFHQALLEPALRQNLSQLVCIEGSKGLLARDREPTCKTPRSMGRHYTHCIVEFENPRDPWRMATS